MRIDLLYGIYSSLFVALFVNTTWNAISDQILLSSHLSWSTESGEHDSVGNGDARWSPRLDQSTCSPHIQNGHLVNANNETLSQQSSIGRRVQVFYRGLKQSSAFIFSYNNTIPAILDVFWVDSGTLFETPTLEEIQYSIKSLVDPITVPSTTLPALGDALRYSWAYDQATFDMVTPPGFDLTWNFSGLTADENLTEEYLPPNQAQPGGIRRSISHGQPDDQERSRRRTLLCGVRFGFTPAGLYRKQPLWPAF